MRGRLLGLAVLATIGVNSQSAFGEPLPFDSKIETYRSEEGAIVAFALRLEQPFLAEEFEQSNTLRLEALDEGAYLIYPKETKFERKHAEFYGRLKGDGTAKVRLSYEVVSEDLAGEPTVDVRTSEIEISVPAEATGIEAVYKEWARRQNAHFADLLEYYPDTSFFEYVLLQSKDRYGVNPPKIPTAGLHQQLKTETGLYHTFSGGLALQLIAAVGRAPRGPAGRGSQRSREQSIASSVEIAGLRRTAQSETGRGGRASSAQSGQGSPSRPVLSAICLNAGGERSDGSFRRMG